MDAALAAAVEFERAAGGESNELREASLLMNCANSDAWIAFLPAVHQSNANDIPEFWGVSNHVR